MNCKCGSENITLHEWLGAYDGWLAYKCSDCGAYVHRSGVEIESAEQRKDYGPVYFKLKDGTCFINLRADENKEL